MAWKAKITSLQEVAVPNDTIDINVTYYDEKSGKQFTKSYNLHASNFKTTDDVKALIVGEATALDTFHSLVEIVKPLIGLDDIVTEIGKI